MNITILQTDILWAQPEANRQRISQLIEHLGPTDLIVLPEMFSTGFATQPEGIAEADGGSLRWMAAMAASTQAALAGSIAIREGERYYNRFYFVKPDGELAFYDKRHLFTYGGEDKAFTPGRDRVVVEWRGVRILLQVCYDLRFPVFSRNHDDYDLVLYVANWPEGRRQAWDLLLRARAIENQCYVVGVNRVGKAQVNYNGGSAIVDFRALCSPHVSTDRNRRPRPSSTCRACRPSASSFPCSTTPTPSGCVNYNVECGVLNVE